MLQNMTLSERLKEFADRRSIIRMEKRACIETQQYERAAAVRDKEKKIEEEVSVFLKEEAKY